MANPRDKYCIVGVGETEYSRNSGKTTRAMGVEAVRKAMNDAGLRPGDIDGMLSYHGNDSTSATAISSDLKNTTPSKPRLWSAFAREQEGLWLERGRA